MRSQTNSAPRRVRVERGIYKRQAATGTAYEVTFLDATGRRRWQRVPGGLQEARQALADAISKTGKGETIAPARTTVADVTAAFLDGPAKQLRPRTQTIYSSHLRLHVLPALGRRKLATVTEDDVLALMAALKAKGLAPWTVHGVLTALSRVFGYATRRGMIAGNPIRRLERGERPTPAAQTDKRILTTDEIGKLLAAASPTYKPLLATAVYTGLRLSELTGLTWADIDLQGGFVRVRKQLSRDGKRVEPKTAQAVREVVLLPALGRLLREHRLASPWSADTDYVFASASGRPLYWRNVSRRGLDAAADKGGLNRPGVPKVTMHSLRNTFASHLILDLKLDVVQVSKQLGHARPSITSDTYARLFDQARHAEDIRERMAASDFGRALGE